MSFDFITVPFSWLLMFLYDMVKSYGLAIILFALVVKLITLYFGMKSKKSMMRQSLLTPKIKELEKKYEGNKAKYQEELMKLQKEEGIKPLGGCLWSLIPFPILIALYSVIRQPFTMMMGLTSSQWAYLKDTIFPSLNMVVSGSNATYEQISYAQLLHERFADVSAKLADNAQAIASSVGAFNVKDIDFSFLGLNLARMPDYKFFLNIQDWSPAAVWPELGLFLIPIISAALSYFASKISQKGSPAAGQQNNMKGFMIMMPLISLYIGFVMPAGLGVYWIASSLFSMLQDIWLTKKYGKELALEQTAREERNKQLEAERELKRQETERLRLENATATNPNTSKRKIQKQIKQKDEQKTAEWLLAHGHIKKKDEKQNPSQVGDRPYARGRNYKPDRFQKGYVPDAEDARENEEGTSEEVQIDKQNLITSGNDEAGINDTSEDSNIDDTASDENNEYDISDEEITDVIEDRHED